MLQGLKARLGWHNMFACKALHLGLRQAME